MIKEIFHTNVEESLLRAYGPFNILSTDAFISENPQCHELVVSEEPDFSFMMNILFQKIIDNKDTCK